MDRQTSSPEPPSWVMRMLKWFCADRFHEEIEGDLYELFLEQVEIHGLKQARRTFPLFLFAYLRPYFFGKKQFFNAPLLSLAMLTNALKITLRQFKRKPVYHLINLTGLVVGMAAALLIFYYIQDERSYDQFHTNKDRIYRIGSDTQLPNSPLIQSARCSRLVAPVLREQYPEVEAVVRLLNRWSPRLTLDQQYIEPELFFAESDFFRIFTFPLLHGDPNTALDEPHSVVITRQTALTYFQTEAAVGKTLTFDDSLLFKVTGVVEDPPVHSHLRFDMLLSYSTWENPKWKNIHEWGNYWIHTYCLLKEGADLAAFDGKLKEMVRDHYGEQMEQYGLDMTLHAEPLAAIYLYSKRSETAGPVGDIRYVYIFGAIALFLILIACINFINLSTARSLDRAREVGIKKAVGSYKWQLISQFLTESVFISFISLVIGALLAIWVLPLFNAVSGKMATAASLLSPSMVMAAVGLSILVGLLAGMYPAWVLASFRPVEVLRGKWTASGRGLLLRKGLIIFQFAISIVLIVASLVVYGQLRYMQNQKLGFDKEQLIVIDATGPGSEKIAPNYQGVKSDMLAHSGIRQVTVSSRVPGAGRGGGVMFPEGLPEGESREMSYFSVDEDFLPAMGIEILAGRNFSREFETDAKQAALINETAVKNIGWSSVEEAIGKEIVAGFNGKAFKVVGVFKDYHHISLREKIEPTFLLLRPSWYSFFSVKIKPADMKTVLDHLASSWEARFPGHAFSYYFLDEYYGRQYKAEKTLGQIFGFFTFLAILIACIGLFGLTIFAVQQRSKEIGIRKVLGSSSIRIFSLLSREFLLLVAISFVIAAPVAYISTNYWLEDFAYRMPQSIWTYVWAGLGTFIFAMLAIGYQTMKAALADPIQSLRYE